MFRKTASASVSLLLLAGSGVQAQAQDTTADGGSASEIADITVTATRMETNLQSTPIAITAVTADELANRSIGSTAELAAIVPNATFRESQGAFGPGVSAFIRGIGQLDTSLGSEPGVAYYIDDVYYPLLLGSNFDLLDLDHVEVLRGPQGTLFGRNALAGAVNVVSKKPSFVSTTGYLNVTGGSYNRLDVRAGFNLPISENLALSVSALSKERRGYQKRLDFRCEMIRRGTPELAGNIPFSDGLQINTQNFTPNNCTVGYLGGDSVRAVRGTALWEISEKASLSITSDYTRDTSELAADTLIAVNTTTANANANLRTEGNFFTAPGGPAVRYDQRFITGDPYTTYNTYADPVAAGTAIPGNSYYNGSSVRGGLRNSPTNDLTHWGVAGKFVYNLIEDIDLTVILGYRDFDETHPFDVDGSPLVVENTLANIGQDYYNGEVRLSGRVSDVGFLNGVDWVGGLFYFHGEGFNHALTVSPYNAVQRYQNTTYEPTSKAAYVNVTVHPLEKLGVTLGGRYSDDEKVVRFSNITDTGANNIIFDVTPADSRVDWKLGADYQLTDVTMIYASAATGFRLPGFNARPLQPSQVSTYDGDETLAYELGVKTDLFDRRLRINATAFYTDYKTRPITVNGQEYLLGANGAPVPGTQVTVPFPTGGDGATTCRVLTPAEIAAGAQGFQCVGRNYYPNTPGKVKGGELEFAARPLEALTMTGAVGYAKFTSPDLELPTRANDRLRDIPEWTASAGLQYELPVSALRGTITPRLDWFYQGSIVYSPNRNDFNQGGYSTLNARISYFKEDNDVTVSLGATNLTDKLYYRNFFVYQDIGFPNVEAQPAPPREWFITVDKKF
jgi:iron complex outermembrane receptor protein